MSGDSENPVSTFLPPALTVSSEEDPLLRAVDIVRKGTIKGTERSGQEHVAVLVSSLFANLEART
jgi:hypothetical protein